MHWKEFVRQVGQLPRIIAWCTVNKTLNTRTRECGLEPSGPGQRPVLGSWEHGSNQPCDNMNWQRFTDCLDVSFSPPVGATAHRRPGSPHYRGFTITLRHTTLDRIPMNGWSARRRDLYLTTHTTHKRLTSMLPAGFKPAIPASEWPKTHALDRAATGIG